MSGRFVSVDRDTAYLFPPSVQEWLPENHLARCVVEIVEQLDLSELTRGYSGRGSGAAAPGSRVNWTSPSFRHLTWSFPSGLNTAA